MYKFLGLPQQHNELFYHDLQVDWHNSDQIVEFLISSVLKPCIVLMLSNHCNYYQSHYSRRVRCPWPVNYDVTYQTIDGSADLFFNETCGSGNGIKCGSTSVNRQETL